eukprot:444710_1
MVNYIHDTKPAVKMQFDTKIDFDKWKEYIVDVLEIEGNDMKIGYIGSDGKLRLLNEKNFSLILIANDPLAPAIELKVGFEPEVPIIDDFSVDISGEFYVNFKSKLMNMFCIDIEPETKEDEIEPRSINTTECNVKINGLNPKSHYRIRVKAENVFSESKWSEWSLYPQPHETGISPQKLPSSLAACSVQNVLFLLNYKFVDDIITEHRKTLKSYIINNNMDGEKLGIMNAQEFAQHVSIYCEDNQVNDAAIIFFNKLKNMNFQEGVPLHRFSIQDICNKIDTWVRNDIKQKRNITEIIKIFKRYQIKRYLKPEIPVDLTKDHVKAEMLVFMSEETLNIIFECFDGWKQQNPNNIAIESQSIDQIVDMLYNFPLQNLLKQIKNEHIDGTSLKELIFEENIQNVIQSHTGWFEQDILQLIALLLKDHTFTEAEFKKNMDRIFQNYEIKLPKTIVKIIKDTILDGEFDIEKIRYNIKHGMDIHEFSDKIINMVDKLIEMHENDQKNNKNEERFQDNFVKCIYDAIAQCFIYNTNISLKKILLDRRYDWKCNNCGNENFYKTINNKQLSDDLKRCSLCGIKQKDSIILKLKNNDTFLMVKDSNQHTEVVNADAGNGMDVVDIVLNLSFNNVLSFNSDHKFDLSCLGQNNTKPCQSIIRLARKLVEHKKWVDVMFKRIDDAQNIDNTIQIDIVKYINNDQFKKIFIECAKNINKIDSTQIDLLKKCLENISNVEEFLKLNRKVFAKKIKQDTKMLPAVAAKLHKSVKQKLLYHARNQKFENFLPNLNIDEIEKDYYHVTKMHIYDGNVNTMKNAFLFFAIVVHYEDDRSVDEDINCKLLQRRTNTFKSLNTKQQKSTLNDSEISTQVKNVWTLKERYKQNQLDVFHSFLVHTKWEDFDQKEEAKRDKSSDFIAPENKHKYVTELSQSSNDNQYKFGVEHVYPSLSPKYLSIHHELLLCTLVTVSETQFQTLMVKAINLHTIVTKQLYKNHQICKYFDIDYNILRNEQIAIRHILSVVAYTDLSRFCSAYRATYRQIDGDKTKEDVTKRHVQLYHYSRSLFESIEFFGEYMESKRIVYHGLNTVLYFEKFTAYFNQPVSTTPSIKVAQEFSQGCGLILSLKAAPRSSNTHKAPKYLSVSWLSDFQNERELLFYGTYIQFQIHDILTCQGKITSHKKELLVLNKFQKTIQGESVQWKDKNVKLIISLIQTKYTIQNDDIQSNYSQALFNYFCDHMSRTIVCIKNFVSLPDLLKNELFRENGNLSLLPMTKLFKNLQEIILNGLSINQMKKQAENFFTMTLEYIKNSSSKIHLEKITIKSERQNNGKPNSILKGLANRNSYNNYGWTARYLYIAGSHSLIFTNKMNNVVSATNVIDSSQLKINKFSSHQNQKPSYFMQITFVDDDEFHIEVLADQKCDY